MAGRLRHKWQEKIAKKATVTLKKFRELESSDHAMGLQRQSFQIENPIKSKPLREQMPEIEGKLPFESGKYHAQKYMELMREVVEIRKQYTKASSVDERKELAKREMDAWTSYQDHRREILKKKKEYEIDEKQLALLRDNFDRFKVRALG